MERDARLRLLARQLFCRSTGAPLIEGNSIEPLIDARANYDAWLSAIRSARASILFENYIFDDDGIAEEFRAALVERAASGIRVALIRDWLGCLGVSREGFWKPLRAVGGEVRTYNSFHLARPFGWVSRDHRKLLVVDSEVGFISGLCVSGRWLGDPARGIAPWRDTGVAVRGPAVRAIALAFADTWASLGEPLPDGLSVTRVPTSPVGTVGMRVVATLPTTAGLYRLSHMVAALASERLWLTDAYFVGTASYMQALSSAARDGVDVRMLVPGSSDLPVVGYLSRSGYRPLLEAGVRVFEWNGSMLHAKTAVADGRWARVGSSNLNVASWKGNREIDVVVEDEPFANRMQAQFEDDLRNATEVLLRPRPRGRLVTQRPPLPRPSARATAGSARSAAGALRLAHGVGAALLDERILESSERSLLSVGALVLLVAGVAAFVWPRALAWPFGAFALWMAVSLAWRFLTVRRDS